MFAEQAYLFRHALLRDAAYQLLPPGARAGLHRMVLDVLEPLANESTLDSGPLALELAEHARLAHAGALNDTDLLHRELTWLAAGAGWAERNYQQAAALGALKAIAAHSLAGATTRIDAARRCALILAGRGEPANALEAAQRAQSVTEETGSVAERGRCLQVLATVHWVAGRHDEAEATARLALELFSANADPLGQGKALGTLAGLLSMASRFDEARPLFVRAIRMHRAAGDQDSMCKTLSNYALMRQHMGAYRTARRLYQRAMKYALLTGRVESQAATTLNLGSLARDEGNADEALRLFSMARDMQHAIGNALGEARAVASIAESQRRARRYGLAEGSYRRAIELHSETGDPWSAGVTLGNYGLMLEETGRPDLAREYHSRALQLHQRVRNLTAWGSTICNLAMLDARMGRRQGFHDQMRTGVELIERGGEPQQIAWYRDQWEQAKKRWPESGQ